MPAKEQVMSQENTEKAKPFSIRLTEQEKDRLREKAGGVPLGIYIRNHLLQRDASPRDERRQYPVKDAEPLGQLLAMLGQSRLASNLNQLAKAANSGSLPVTEETETDLRRACAEIAEMRQLLLRSLGIRILEQAKTPLPVVEFFTEAAGVPQL
jgi:hypothetical protein